MQIVIILVPVVVEDHVVEIGQEAVHLFVGIIVGLGGLGGLVRDELLDEIALDVGQEAVHHLAECQVQNMKNVFGVACLHHPMITIHHLALQEHLELTNL